MGSLDTNYGEPVILNDKFTQYLDTGAYTLEFDAVFDARVDSEYADKLQERNYLIQLQPYYKIQTSAWGEYPHKLKIYQVV